MSESRDVDSRLERWRVSDSTLALIETYAKSLPSQIEKIEITNRGLILNYEVDSNISIKLRIIPGQHRSVANMLISEGEYEQFEMKIFIEIVKICKNFLDVGANVGFYTICAYKANKNLAITSSEPNAQAFDELNSNLKLNNIHSVNSLNYALVNINSESQPFFVSKFMGNASGSLSNLHPDDAETIYVKTRALDSILQNFDLVKIDIEGSEFEFLKGAIKFIQTSNPTIFVELLRKWMKNFNSSPQIFLSSLVELGYTCYSISDKFLKVCKIIDESTIETNFIFVHRDNKRVLKIINKYL